MGSKKAIDRMLSNRMPNQGKFVNIFLEGEGNIVFILYEIRRYSFSKLG
jgi:hypothetical protein